jgi:hypothetical protein
MSNYEWEKQHTKHRINDRLREAEIHRLASIGPPSPRSNRVSALFRAFATLLRPRRRKDHSYPLHVERDKRQSI